MESRNGLAGASGARRESDLRSSGGDCDDLRNVDRDRLDSSAVDGFCESCGYRGRLTNGECRDCYEPPEQSVGDGWMSGGE